MTILKQAAISALLVAAAQTVTGCIFPQEGSDGGVYLVDFVIDDDEARDGMLLELDPIDLEQPDGFSNSERTLVDNGRIDNVVRVFTSAGTDPGQLCFRGEANFVVGDEIVGRIPPGSCFNTGRAVFVDFEDPAFAP